MEAIQVIDNTYLVPLASGRAIMVGSPPEALKVLNLWGHPAPAAVVLPPDPLYADGINQASVEFLLFNHLFVRGGLRNRDPFVVVCDPEQTERVEELLRQMLRGPSDAQMARWRTPASHRKQILLETMVVSGEVASLRLEQMARVIPLKEEGAWLADNTRIERGEGDTIRIVSGDDALVVPRRAQTRTQMPFYFADVEMPVVGPRFGLQVIGSASGFAAKEWSSCFIVWINGQPLIIDGTPYLDDHLRRLGIEDDHILGYLITHNHEDHANMVGQLVSRRPVTILTSPPVMAGLVARLSPILQCPEPDVRKLFRWIPLHPGLEGFGTPLPWFGAEIRTWYSVHTVPTLGLDISMEGRHIRMPGDTLWGRQLDPLLEQKVISPARYHFIQHSYDGADVIVADAGGGPIHPDPQEVSELLSHDSNCRLMVTHAPDFARKFLPTAEPGATVTLIQRQERTPEEAMGLFGSPILRKFPERWLLTLLYGGDVVAPGDEPFTLGTDACVVLSGSLSLQREGEHWLTLQRGDVFHAGLAPAEPPLSLRSVAKWTRILRLPEALFQAFVKDTACAKMLGRLYRTRPWWPLVAGEELGLDTMVALAELCREREYPAHHEIVRQGEAADNFYILTTGCVSISRENGHTREFGTFGPGYHFGEIALLGEEQRTATVRTTEPTSVLELPSLAFRRILMEIPLARFHVGRRAERRRAEIFGSPGLPPARRSAT